MFLQNGFLWKTMRFYMRIITLIAIIIQKTIFSCEIRVPIRKYDFSCNMNKAPLWDRLQC